MSWIWLNIPLCVLAVVFTVGLPLWVMLKYPDDADTSVAQTAAPRPREHAVAAEVRQVGTRELYPTAS